MIVTRHVCNDVWWPSSKNINSIEKPKAQFGLSQFQMPMKLFEHFCDNKGEQDLPYIKIWSWRKQYTVHFFNCSWWNYFNFYTYFWISLKNLTDLDVWPPFWPWLFLHKMQKKKRLKRRPNITIGQIFQWNPKIYIKIERISPRAIKKVDRHPSKSWPQCWQFWTLGWL